MAEAKSPAPLGPTGVRVGRLPPRGEGSVAPPPEFARAPSVAPGSSTPALVVTPTARAPFRHETWQSVDRVAKETDLGELNPDQRKAIRSALEAHDTLVTMPSGRERTACFVVPARLTTQPVLVLNARPHLLRELADRLSSRRVPNVRLDASTIERDVGKALERIAAGGPLLVLATPGLLLADTLPRALAKSGVAFVVVDDAEVSVASSDELSPAAHALAKALGRLGSPPVMALTSAATPVTRHEIIDTLGLRSPTLVEGRVLRDSVSLDVIEARGEARQRALVQLALRLRRPGIIFAPTARDVDAIYGALAALRLPVHRFHPHLPPGERVGEQLNFFVPGRRSIMVATSAFAAPSGIVGVGEAELLDRAPNDFGLGVEKRDIRFVLHWALPPSLEQYVREITLAGRDGDEASAVAFHDSSDRSRNESSLPESRLSQRHLSQLVKALEPGAIDGRPRTLEALALSSGLSRRLTETLVGVLADAALVAHASGWVKTRVTARTLSEEAHRLGSALERLRSLDAMRLDAMAHYASTRSCFTRALEHHFGERAEGACGRCGTCRGSLLPGFEALPETRHVRHAAVETFSIGQDDGYGLRVAAPAREVRPLRVTVGELQRAR